MPCNQPARVEPCKLQRAACAAGVLVAPLRWGDRLDSEVTRGTERLLFGARVQEKGQLLENVFADPKGFGIAPDGRYRYELPGFSSGTAQVS